MHLVDYPTVVGGQDCNRVPIIITGNDFTKLYAPFVRAGRLLAYEFAPKPVEKSKIINGIFPELTENECQLLFNDFDIFIQNHQNKNPNSIPISFFAQLKSHCIDKSISQKIDQSGFRKLFSQIRGNKDIQLKSDVNLDDLKRLGMELLKSGSFVNHIK